MILETAYLTSYLKQKPTQDQDQALFQTMTKNQYQEMTKIKTTPGPGAIPDQDQDLD